MTVILVTHEMEVALQAKRIIRMRDGQIVEDRRVDNDLRRDLKIEAGSGWPEKSPPPMARQAGV